MGYNTEKKYSIENTTKVIREKIVKDALAISTMDAAEPTEKTMKLVQKYIDGEKEISEVLQDVIYYYKIVNR